MNRKFLKILLFMILFSAVIFGKGRNMFSTDFSYKREKTADLKDNVSKISSERAKEIALNHARVSKNNARFKKIGLKTKKGVLIYKIEFYVDKTRYQYEIDARNGIILKAKNNLKNK